MRTRVPLIIATGAIVFAGLFANAHADVKPLVLENDQAKLSYTLGANLGTQFKARGVDVEADVFMRGLQDGLTQQPLLLTPEEMRNVSMSFQKNLISKRDQEIKRTSDQNAKAGKDFLTANAKKPGVVRLPSGLQYRVVKPGKGVKPLDNDEVTVNYVGKLLDGNVFDSSYKTGKPAKFVVSQVIQGWSEALKLMQPGAVWELYIPPELAYGPKGIGSPIGPNETLLFKVELIAVKPSKA